MGGSIMASIISAGTTSGTALNMTGDTSGQLQLQTNGTTTAVTIDTSQNTTFVGSVNAPNTFGFKNRIINGAMMIDQRNAGAVFTLTNGADSFGTDRWKFYRDVGGTFTVQRSTTAPTGFVNSLVVTASTGASPGAANLNFFQQAIEGYNVADLGWGTVNAKTITVSFWVRSSIAGTYAVTLANNAADRTYISTITISSANTFEYKTITVAGDTAGTWVTDSNTGLRVYFDLGSGSNYNGTANTWGAGLKLRTTGSVTWGATTGATFYLTGVQIEKGSTATSFDFRPYSAELQLCQRYYCCIPVFNTSELFGYSYATNSSVISFTFPMTMRSPPTSLTTTGTIQGFNATNGASTATLSWNTAGYNTASFVAAFTSTAGTPTRISTGAAGYIGFNGAEL
jgi:hypothetical protein